MKPDRKELNQEKLEQISGGGVDITHVFSREPNTCTHPHAVKTPWQCEDEHFIFWTRHQFAYLCPDCKEIFWVNED
jgi:bacteriocin-like protein